MKTIIIGINSKYIHSSLAFTINDNSEYVLSRIYAEGCDVKFENGSARCEDNTWRTGSLL